MDAEDNEARSARGISDTLRWLADLEQLNERSREDYERTKNFMHVLTVIKRTALWPSFMAPGLPRSLLPVLPLPAWCMGVLCEWASGASSLWQGRNPLKEPSRDDKAAWDEWFKSKDVSFDKAPQLMLEFMGMAGGQGKNMFRAFDSEMRKRGDDDNKQFALNQGLSEREANKLLKDPSVRPDDFDAAVRRAAAAQVMPKIQDRKVKNKPRGRLVLD